MARRDGSLWVVIDTKTRVAPGATGRPAGKSADYKVYALETVWTISRGRDTYGYNICTLWVDGNRTTRCNGGGYDMTGTVIGDWLAAQFPERLRRLTKPFYGLSFHDPNYDAGKALIDGETVEEREKAGKSLGLERYQAFHGASSETPTKRHTIPLLDGACGHNCMLRVAEAIGLKFEYKR